MLRFIDSIIAREEAFLPKFAPSTSQHSLLKNRIAALYTVRDLLTGESQPDRAALAFALPRIESMLRKMQKARDKHEPGSRSYRRFDPAVQQLAEARTLILLQRMEVTP